MKFNYKRKFSLSRYRRRRRNRRNTRLMDLNDDILIDIFQHLDLIDVYILEKHVSPLFSNAANLHYRKYASVCRYPTALENEHIPYEKLLCRVGKYIQNLTVEYYLITTIEYDHALIRRYCRNVKHLCLYAGNVPNEDILCLNKLKSLQICGFNELCERSDDYISKYIQKSYFTLESLTLEGMGRITGKCLYSLPRELKRLSLKWMSTLNPDSLLAYLTRNTNLMYFENITMDEHSDRKFNSKAAQIWNKLTATASVSLSSTLCQQINSPSTFEKMTRFTYVLKGTSEENLSVNDLLCQLSECNNLEELTFDGRISKSIRRIQIFQNTKSFFLKFKNLKKICLIKCSFVTNSILEDFTNIANIRHLTFSETKYVTGTGLLTVLKQFRKLETLTLNSCIIKVKEERDKLEKLLERKRYGVKGWSGQVITKSPNTWTDLSIEKVQYNSGVLYINQMGPVLNIKRSFYSYDILL